MNQGQGDMLGVEADADVERMLGAAEQPESAWAPMLADLLRVFEAKFRRKGMDAEKAFKAAVDVILTMSEYFGGRMAYIPKGVKLQAALKHAAIYREYNRARHREIAAKFELSEIYLYEVIRAQEALHTRRLQGRLFEE